MEKKTTFQKKHSIVKRVLSFVLVFAMILTMGAFSQMGQIVAKAADTVKLYFELPEGTSVTDWAVNPWSGKVITGDFEHKFRPIPWGDGDEYPTLLAVENLSGWGYVEVSTSLTGIQFVKSDGTEKNKWNSLITEQSLSEAYYSTNNSAWYKDAECQQEIRPSFDTATITMHFQKPDEWEAVYTKIACGSWVPINGYSYAFEWPGAAVEVDANNIGWYSFTISMPTDQFECIFNNNNNGSQTGNIVFTPEKALTEKWVTFTEHGAPPNITDTAPAGWVDSTSNPPINPNAGSSIKSPVVNADRTVTVKLDATGKYEGAEKVLLMGTLNGTDWSTGLAMALDSNEGVYTVTTPVQNPGIYGYKFTVDGSWITDPMNESTIDGNSKVVVPGIASVSMQAKTGEATALPTTLKQYDAAGNVTEVEPVYSVDDKYAADVTIADGKITVKEGTALTEVLVDATIGSETATVTVAVVGEIYTYNVYFHGKTEHMSTEAADLWAWEDGGANLGPIDFTSLETLEDGNQWLKATVTTAATKIGLITRSKGGWDWQTVNHFYTNKDKAEEVNLYIVENDNKTYTTIPEIRESRKRNVVVEYTRDKADYEGWNIYSWNTGMGSGTEIYGDVTNGVAYMNVPVEDYTVDLNLAFCMRRTTEDEPWAEKDGGDHYILVPADQVAVKAKFVQGKGITGLYPYNIGYEMDGDNDRIRFYYRDDELFIKNQEETLAKVVVNVNNTAYEMSYDSVNQRYYYDLTNVTTGKYFYNYEVTNAAGETVTVLDKFNSRTNDDESASFITYKKFANLGINASAYYNTMDDDDNNVVAVTFAGEDKDNITSSEVASASIDLTELGLGVQAIDTKLMATTIACKNSVAAGEKTLPVTVKDIYGNTYKTTVKVTVKENAALDSDFDWDEAVVYFAVTDRFFDGSDANNAGVNKDGSLSYHGGDFAGLQAKLDYLKDLGVNTIWITPILQNSDVTTEKDGETIESTGYHGYWADDFTKLNPHLGTEAEFAALIDAVHAKGMKLMVDVVLNHAGYNTEDYFNTLLTDGSGNYISMLRDDDNTVSGSDIYASLAGLPDFVTENAVVRDQIIAWQTGWMSKYDIDYYRVDTVKHVDSTTWKAFKNALTKVNQDFKLIGEEAGSGYGSNSANWANGAMDALLDFDFNNFAEDFLSGNITSVEASLAKRNTTINNAATLGSFINSHDEDGLQAKLQKNKEMTAAQTLELMKVAATLSITAKGIPVIYYGEELGLYGEDNYPYQTNRYDFDWALMAKQSADSTSIYNHYKKLLAIRNGYTDVFARGTRTMLAASDELGYDVFARAYQDTTIYTALNITANAQNVSFTVPDAAGKEYVDLYSGTVYKTDAEGKVTVAIPAAKDGGTVVLIKKEQPEQKPEDKPEQKPEDKPEQKPAQNTNQPITVGSTTTNADGSVTSASTVYDKDGTVTTTEVTTYPDGTVSEKKNTTVPGVSVTTVETTKNADGSSKTKEVVANVDGSVAVTTTTVNVDGSAKIVAQKNAVNDFGNIEEKTKTTNMDAAGVVTGVTEKTVIPEAAKNTAVSVVVKKSGEGAVTSAKATVKSTVSGSKTTISGAVVNQINAAAGTGTEIMVKVSDKNGNTLYNLKADSKALKAGNTLYVYKLNTKTGEYTMVNSTKYKVNKSGSVAVSMNAKATYELVSKKNASTIDKKILSAVKVKNSSASVKTGKKTSVAMSSKLNMANVKKITYTSSDKAVATVSKSGKVSAKNAGKVVIKAKVTLKNGKTKTVKMTITVK